MKKLTLNILFCFIMIFALFGSQLFAQNFKVIVNNECTVSSLTTTQISNIFLKKTTRLNGSNAMPVDHLVENNVRIVFSEEIHGQSPKSIRRYWQKQVFSGRAVPPPEKTSDREILDYVQTHPGGIGYVSASTVTNNEVKVIKVISEIK